MGWQDRDYAHSPSRRGSSWGGGPFATGYGPGVVSMLLAANVALFVLVALTAERSGTRLSPVFALGALHTPSVLGGQIWRVWTATYLHWDLHHLFVNMLGLYFLGQPLERDFGRRRFFVFYTLAGIIGNLFYLAVTFAGWLPVEGLAAGASGSILGLVGACAVRYPHAQLLIYFLFPIRIRTAALLLSGYYVLNLLTRGANAGGDACHLAGMVYGAWWEWRGRAWWLGSSLSRVRAPWRRRSGMDGYLSSTRRGNRFVDRIAQQREDAETIDRILRKVYDGGLHSLTEAEKRALQEATERQRAREREAGRIDKL